MKSKKRERFEKVAKNRVVKITEALRLLGNCSNQNNYEYSEEDVKKMFDAILTAYKDANSRFKFELKKDEYKTFKFK